MDISFKAALFDRDDRVLLGANPRGEWELLGGRADPADLTPQDTIVRELGEEAGIRARIGPLIDIWYYDIAHEGRVAVATYLAWSGEEVALTISSEHTRVRFFAPEEIETLTMPGGYKRSIRLARRLALRELEGREPNEEEEKKKKKDD